MKALKVAKRTFLSTVAGLALIIGSSAAHAAPTVWFSGPTEVNVFAQNQFTVDVFIDDIAPLSNLMAWSLGFETSNAQIVGMSGKTEDNYVFKGNSYDFQGVIQDGIHYLAGDLTSDGSGVNAANAAGLLLGHLTVDVTNTQVGDIISIDLYGPGTWTLFMDDAGNVESPTISGGAYTASAVPIPGAVWLLGSGLCGLLGWCRKVRDA